MATGKWIITTMLVVGAVAPSFAADPAPADLERIKTTLLRSTGWSIHWSECFIPPESGESAGVMEARGDKIVAKLQSTPYLSCERDVTITAKGATFHGCRDRNITLFFHPDDQEYPFKGWGETCQEYKLKAK